MSLASLHSWIVFFSESNSAPRALPFSSSQGPVRKKQRGITSLSPQREVSSVCFCHPDQCPSAIVSDLVSFGGSDEEPVDGSMSIVASDAEEWSGSLHDPAIEQLGLEWSVPHKLTRSQLDEWFLPGRHHAPPQRAAPFFHEVHDELTMLWHAPYSPRLHPPASHTLTSLDATEQTDYEKLSLLDEAVAAHLCPPAAIGWKMKVVHPSKPCRTMSALAGWAYSSAGQAASALHTMAWRLLQAQAIRNSMASLVVLEHYLWLSLTEIKDADKGVFLNSPVSPTGLFGPAVDGFAERFTATPKSSQTLPAKALLPFLFEPPQTCATPRPEHLQRSCSAKRHPQKRQGPRPKIVLDPEPQKMA
ncbi:hypothetical protein DPX16_2672 [Anabarilius grahami]|uniref:Uncharacterized protein n=1 Tax=Anabarilius grahami TaxID=495550 RepID=A0A3N0YQ48_ANAGA|nr:hypothetical protein DPX16_2672 [Anabarilius grahami]